MSVIQLIFHQAVDAVPDPTPQKQNSHSIAASYSNTNKRGKTLERVSTFISSVLLAKAQDRPNNKQIRLCRKGSIIEH
jgi:hypothetical protein